MHADICETYGSSSNANSASMGLKHRSFESTQTLRSVGSYVHNGSVTFENIQIFKLVIHWTVRSESKGRI
jgi:hypothetical protein